MTGYRFCQRCSWPGKEESKTKMYLAGRTGKLSLDYIDRFVMKITRRTEHNMPTVNKEPIAILPGSDSEFELDIRVSTHNIDEPQNSIPTRAGNTCHTCNCTGGLSCFITCNTCYGPGCP